jgi:hypothetical protein
MMLFYWKDGKDQLFVRRGELPSKDRDPVKDSWTSFEMRLRESAPIPTAFDFTRFLASSITFMSHLSEVCVYFDDMRLARLTKSSGGAAMSKELGVPKGLVGRSRTGYVNVKGVRSTRGFHFYMKAGCIEFTNFLALHIKAEVMRWVYTSGSKKPPPPSSQKSITANGTTGSTTTGTKALSTTGFFSSIFASLSASNTPHRSNTPLPSIAAPKPAVKAEEELDLKKIHETAVMLTIFSADVDVSLDRKVAQELVRSTKKKTPERLKFELIYVRILFFSRETHFIYTALCWH